MSKKIVATALAGLLFLAATPVGAAENELVIYTYDSFTSDWGPGPAIEAAFEAECDCDLVWVGIESSLAILSRLQLEGESSQADIVLGLDSSSMQTAKDTGLLVEHGVTPAVDSLPYGWDDDTFLPFDWGYFAFIYDSETLTAPPSSLAELIADENGPSLVIQDPRFSTPGLGLLLWVKEVYGEDAQAAWEKLAPRLVTVTPSWGEAYGLFLDGEADMVLSYTTSPAYHLTAEGVDRYKAALFSEGHYAQVEVAARTTTGQSPDLADRFLHFMTSAAFQETIPTGNWMYPVTALGDDKMPDAFSALIDPAPLPLIPAAEVATHRADWIAEWLRALDR